MWEVAWVPACAGMTKRGRWGVVAPPSSLRPHPSFLRPLPSFLRRQEPRAPNFPQPCYHAPRRTKVRAMPTSTPANQLRTPGAAIHAGASLSNPEQIRTNLNKPERRRTVRPDRSALRITPEHPKKTQPEHRRRLAASYPPCVAAATVRVKCLQNFVEGGGGLSKSLVGLGAHLNALSGRCAAE